MKKYRVAEVELVRAVRELPETFASFSEALDHLRSRASQDAPGVVILEVDGEEIWRIEQDERKRDRWIKTEMGSNRKSVHAVGPDGLRRPIRNV